MGGVVKAVTVALVLAAPAASEEWVNGVASDFMSTDALPALPTRDPSNSWQARARAKQLLYAGQWPTETLTERPTLGTQSVRSWLNGGALERMSGLFGQEQSERDPNQASQCKLWASDPEQAICPGDFGTTVKCSLCLQAPQNIIKLKLSNCSKAEEQFFCNPGPELSLRCSTALADAFGPKHQNDPGHSPLDMYQGFGSWSMHLNEPGHYYQCNGLDGFHYWVSYMHEFTSPPWAKPHEEDGEATNGGVNMQAGDNKGGPPPYSIAVCVPDECSNEKDVNRITSDYVHYGLLHYWLANEISVEPKAPPLDVNAKIVIGFICACAALCAVSTVGNSSWLSTCRAAMPMRENVAKRLETLLARFPDRATEVTAMSELEQWRFVKEMEAEEVDIVTAGGLGSLQGGGLHDPLLQQARPTTLRLLQSKTGQPSNSAREHNPDGFLFKVVRCWDAGLNWRTGLMKKDGGIPEMRVLNGLRVLSMGWVVLCHGFLFQISQANVQNKAYATADVGNRFISTLLPNGTFSVDTFFVLSGYLGAYVALRKLNAMDKAGKKIPNPFILAFNFLLERYLRLTPAYAFVLMFYMYVLPHIITGPHSLDPATSPELVHKIAPDQNGVGDFLFCQRYVWTNLLYISNLIPVHDHMFNTKYGEQFAGGAFGLKDAHGGMGCMGHSWFLSNDFQMHLLLPWLLLLFRWKKTAAYVVMVGGIGASLAYLGFLVHEYHWSMGCNDRGFDGNQQALYYGKPWCRISPWLAGVLLACYQSANSTRSGHLKPPGALKIAVGYIMCGAVLWVCVFTPYWAHGHGKDMFEKECGWSHTWDTIYSIFSRAAWGAGICYIIYAALTCQGGPLTRFLTWSFWTPFARLTYGWYLIHPLVMDAIYDSNPAGENYYDELGVAFYCYNIIIGLLCSATIFFLVELPAANLKNLVMPLVYAGIGYVITCGKKSTARGATGTS